MTGDWLMMMDFTDDERRELLTAVEESAGRYAPMALAAAEARGYRWAIATVRVLADDYRHEHASHDLLLAVADYLEQRHAALAAAAIQAEVGP